MKVLITGATGLIGTELSSQLAKDGHETTPLTRKANTQKGIYWDPFAGKVDSSLLEGFDAVVNLAGENIAGYWSENKKKKILESRLYVTRLLSETLAKLSNPPAVMVSASAIGIYGDRGDEILTESSSPGTGFLAKVCQEWELATRAAEAKGIRVVHHRISVALTPKGGAFATMLTPFKLGLGGQLGNGNQFLSWIDMDDLISSILFCIKTNSIRGAVNATSPNPVRNKEFTRILGQVLNRPTLLTIPSFVAELFAGQAANEILFWGRRALPEKLMNAGFQFQYPELKSCLKHLTG